MSQTYPDIPVNSRTELREWLVDHHDNSGTVWLIIHKKPSDLYITYEEIVQELLAWGWIDGTRKKVDAERTGLRISPRNPKSAWSALNKMHIETLRATGQMTPAGERAIAISQENGMWEFLDDVERLELPDDLRAAIGAGMTTWDDYPKSVKRGTLAWVKMAKRPDTRANRIEAIATATRNGERPPSPA